MSSCLLRVSATYSTLRSCIFSHVRPTASGSKSGRRRITRSASRPFARCTVESVTAPFPRTQRPHPQPLHPPRSSPMPNSRAAVAARSPSTPPASPVPTPIAPTSASPIQCARPRRLWRPRPADLHPGLLLPGLRPQSDLAPPHPLVSPQDRLGYRRSSLARYRRRPQPMRGRPGLPPPGSLCPDVALTRRPALVHLA